MSEGKFKRRTMVCWEEHRDDIGSGATLIAFSKEYIAAHQANRGLGIFDMDGKLLKLHTPMEPRTPKYLKIIGNKLVLLEETTLTTFDLTNRMLYCYNHNLPKFQVLLL